MIGFSYSKKRLNSIDPQITSEIRNHKLLIKLPEDLEHALKCICSKEFTLDAISNTLQEVRRRTHIGRYYTDRAGDNRESPTLEAKEAQYSKVQMTKACHKCGSPNHYENSFSKGREEVFSGIH
ncbi:hypothetical protein O181_002926 [Austropuccinia psidii MF-1]|uniref:Uncharacterized protein n=1 Tax=Austropuccinia psidii MF-1 TaxID=1389203 RepID=A0A9Q3GDN9_9BASI|nr:hypothetical protein [Austropuccinia psidii MF-1]